MTRVTLWGNHEAGRLIGEAINEPFDPEMDQVMATFENGKLLGGVIFTRCHLGASIQMHIASVTKRWITKQIVWMAFDYAFNYCGVKKVIALVATDRAEALAFVRKLGFKCEAVIDDVFPDAGMAVYTITRAECWALNMIPRSRIHGQESTSASPAA